MDCSLKRVRDREKVVVFEAVRNVEFVGRAREKKRETGGNRRKKQKKMNGASMRYSKEAMRKRARDGVNERCDNEGRENTEKECEGGKE